MVRTMAALCLAIALASMSVAGQTPDSSPAIDTNFVLHDGETVVMRALQRVTSADATVGQEIQFEVITAVQVGGLIVISEHAAATARVIAVERTRRMGRGGKLAIAIERVRLVDGEAAPLRAVIDRTAGGKGQMAADMAGTFVATYGLSLPLTPFFLLKHGNDMAVSPGDRFVAYVDGNIGMDRNLIAAAQSGLVAPINIGTVYLFRGTSDSKNLPQIPVNCGDALVGVFHQDHFVRMELQPGLYWFRAGEATYKNMQRVSRNELFPLHVEGGSSYYLQVRAVRTSKWGADWGALLEQISAKAGADAVSRTNYRAERAIEVGPTDLEALQKQAPADIRRQPFPADH